MTEIFKHWSNDSIDNRSEHQPACYVRYSDNLAKSFVVPRHTDGKFYCPRCAFASQHPRPLQAHTKKKCTGPSSLIPPLRTRQPCRDRRRSNVTNQTLAIEREDIPHACVNDVDVNKDTRGLEKGKPSTDANTGDQETQESSYVKETWNPGSEANLVVSDHATDALEDVVLELEYPEDCESPPKSDLRRPFEHLAAAPGPTSHVHMAVALTEELGPQRWASSTPVKSSSVTENPAQEVAQTDVRPNSYITQRVHIHRSRPLGTTISVFQHLSDKPIVQQPTPPAASRSSMISTPGKQFTTVKHEVLPNSLNSSVFPAPTLTAAGAANPSNYPSSSPLPSLCVSIGLDPDIRPDCPTASPAVIAFLSSLSVSSPPIHLVGVFQELGFVTDELLDVLADTAEAWHKVEQLVVKRGTYAQWVLIMRGLKARATKLHMAP
ncbi:hypothetical protein AcV5_004945 [Taiwanofungus camphoratus]|nr:hypothetical protein AcV5_004945 [Antrodia cinnamomea]